MCTLRCNLSFQQFRAKKGRFGEYFICYNSIIFYILVKKKPIEVVPVYSDEGEEYGIEVLVEQVPDEPVLSVRPLHTPKHELLAFPKMGKKVFSFEQCDSKLDRYSTENINMFP